MPVIKLSFVGQGPELDQIIELDDELFGQLQATVDAEPDLTMGEAVRQGIQHVVEARRSGGGQQ